MKIPIYKSYGVLAHEYQPVYTWACPQSDVYDEIIVEVPNVDGENCDGDPLVNLGDGLVYPLRMVLGSWGDEPALIWYDGAVQRHKILKAYFCKYKDNGKKDGKKRVKKEKHGKMRHYLRPLLPAPKKRTI